MGPVNCPNPPSFQQLTQEFDQTRELYWFPKPILHFSSLEFMMTTHSKQQYGQVDLINIVLFLKASGRIVLLSTATCLLAGATYYLAVPKIYESSASIQMAMVAGELVESPERLLEKIKLPLFFSATTHQACGLVGKFVSQYEFTNKLKPVLNKSSTLISFSVQARSSQESRACLEAVIGEIQQSQMKTVKHLVEQKIQLIEQLNEQLKLAQEMSQSVYSARDARNGLDLPLKSWIAFTMHNLSEKGGLQTQIKTLESDLNPPKFQSTVLVAPVFSPEDPINKKLLFTMVLSLALGVFLGLLISWVMHGVLPNIGRHMRDA